MCHGVAPIFIGGLQAAGCYALPRLLCPGDALLFPGFARFSILRRVVMVCK